MDERHDHSWFGEKVQSDDGPIEAPASEEEVIRILADTARFPAPVRPVGSRHSMTSCISAQAPGPDGPAPIWGTLVETRLLTRLRKGMAAADGSLLVVPDPGGKSGRVTVPAGRTFIDVARELNAQGWLFQVNTELGTLTIGAGACGATKDSSFPGEFGQVCHDAIGMRIVKPDGTVEDLQEGDRDFNALRCSYGLFGIVTEVTFRVFPREFISMRHEDLKPRNGGRFTSDELAATFDRWLGRNGGEARAVFLYLFPYHDRLVAELRSKPAPENGEAHEKSVRLGVRNHFWEKGAVDVERAAKATGIAPLQHVVESVFGAVLREFLEHVLRLTKVNPVAQIVDFDKEDKDHRFTFSMWAFPEARFAEILPQYFQFCQERKNFFRTGLPHASYHIAQDDSSLLSYSRHGPVWTLDPISPENLTPVEKQGWERFLDEFNAFCSDRGGMPLLNQTPRLTPEQVQRAFADRLPDYLEARDRFDPDRRMLNKYFADLFGL